MQAHRYGRAASETGARGRGSGGPGGVATAGGRNVGLEFERRAGGSAPAGQGGDRVQKITPFLWFDGQAEEAARFYASVFKNSKIGKVVRYGDAGPGPKGSVMIVPFQLDGQDFLALNGGPQFTFNEAVSFVVNCTTQAEIDSFWEKLSESGQPGQCGWLKDRYGVSWQIVPTALGELMQSGNAEQSRRVMAAVLQMRKIDIGALERAFTQA
jgi:predicted 3-demethylubiquinone-9 3-methyltransferase (glyoxalase superfamily)